MTVEFRFWGSSELCSRLAEERHAGRLRFWFGREQFSAEWFQRRAEESIANLHRRYLPSLHINIDELDAAFGTLLHDEFLTTHLNHRYAPLRRSFTAMRQLPERRFFEAEFDALTAHLAQLETTFAAVLSAADRSHFYCSDGAIHLEELTTPIRRAQDALETCIEAADRARRDEVDSGTTHPNRRDFRAAIGHLYGMSDALSDLTLMIEEPVPGALCNAVGLLLVGSAGSGKSHQFARIADTHVRAGTPTVLLLGQQFDSGPLWPQILSRLGLACSQDEFLGALEAAAQARATRALILIDAINETDDKALWRNELAGFLTAVARYRSVAVAISVRQSYAEHVVPAELIGTRLVRLHHGGFSGREDEAAQVYFTHYGIKPTMPLLRPEFSNPLFLQLLCEALSNAKRGRCETFSGISMLLSAATDAVNRRVSTALGCDPADHVVNAAIKRLVAEMVARRRRHLLRQEARDLVNSGLPSVRYENSLFRHLIDEGLIAEELYRTPDGREEYVRFAYERFGDFWIAQELLTLHVTRENSRDVFVGAGRLAKVCHDQRSCWHNSGLIEAFSILLPERYGLEFLDAAPHTSDIDAARSAFLSSLSWRTPAAVTDRAEEILQQWLSTDQLRDDTLDALLAIASDRHHRFNAAWLNRWLAGLGMPERDRVWSTYLHRRAGPGAAPMRLVHWSWSHRDKSHYDSETVRLVGLMLAWFLTTPNRPLRDAATKALVSVFEHRLDDLRILLSTLHRVDDAYVAERLYAVACGCALRSNDSDRLGSLARDVYDAVFKAGSPPKHILLREYARLVVERAIHLRCISDIDQQLIRPPYRSSGLLDAPPWDELREQLKAEEYSPLVLSLWPGHGDFARYVLGDGFTTGVDAWVYDPTPFREMALEPDHIRVQRDLQEIMDKLLDEISPEALATIAKYAEDETVDATRSVEVNAALGELVERLSDEDRELLEERGAAEQAAWERDRCLRRLQEKQSLPHDLPSRWILQRVLQLGWTPERFADFDRHYLDYDRRMYGRESDKPERVGKKYQWIAFHEFLAILTDCRPYRVGFRELFQYAGTWQLGFRRDIDPTCLLFDTRFREEIKEPVPWWTRCPYDEWRPKLDVESWMKDEADLPPIGPFIESTRPSDRSRWLSLETFASWKQPIPPGEERYESMHRDLWYMIRSYIVRREDADAFFSWAIQQDFMGRWMPESHDLHDLFAREFFWAPAFHDIRAEERPDAAWTRGWDQRVPCEVLVPAAGYSWSRGYDCSIKQSVSFRTPGVLLANWMKLSCGRRDGEFVNEVGELVAFDPCCYEDGPASLLMRRDVFLEFLESNGLEVIWTLLGEKRYHPGGIGMADRVKGWLQLSGAYRLRGDDLEGRWTTQYHVPQR